MLDCIAEAIALLCCVAVIVIIRAVPVAGGSPGLFWILAFGRWGDESFVFDPYVLICGGQSSVDFVMRRRGGTALLLWRALVPRLIRVVAVSLHPMATVGAAPLVSGGATWLPFILSVVKVLILRRRLLLWWRSGKC